MEIPTGDNEEVVPEQEENHSVKVELRLPESDEGTDDILLDSKESNLEESVLELKEELAAKQNKQPQCFSISYQGEMLSDATTLSELGVQPDTTVILIVQVTEAPAPQVTDSSSSPEHDSQLQVDPSLDDPDVADPTPGDTVDPTLGDTVDPTLGDTVDPIPSDAADSDTTDPIPGDTVEPVTVDHGTAPPDTTTLVPNDREGTSQQTITRDDDEITTTTLITKVEVGQETRNIHIKLIKPKTEKLFLGGYRSRLTGVEYHHASAQTRPKLHKANVVRYDRDCQTVFERNKRQQVTVDAATQMNKTGCFINDCTDKIVPIIGIYETAEHYHKRILEKVIILQSYWRRWLAICYVNGLRQDKIKLEEWQKAELLRRQREREEHAKREFDRRMNPRTKEDFNLLYHALEVWRQEELAHINETTSGPERKAALCCLLEQEAQLIASIGRHKVVADQENLVIERNRFLDKTAAPRQWTAFDGKITSMNTPFTLRGQQLRDLYSTLNLKGLSNDERLDVLLTLKSTVKEHDCQLTRDIIELVDREADLIVRGHKEHTLQGLRKRISSLYFQYCKIPLFNPEAAKHIKVPQDPSTLCSKVYYCRSCSQYLPSTDFELSVNSRCVGVCRVCRDLDNRARAREDWSMYRALLQSIRKVEEAYKDHSHIIFLMQETDLRYLVENIWGGQSALSASKDFYDLTMVRWESSKHWSPWNCLLLTRDEAKAHAQLDSVEEAYGVQFVQKVKSRHILAQSYFSYIPEMAEEIQGKVKKLPLPPPKEKEVIVHMQLSHSDAARDRISSQT